jgi:hypothetical protein
MLVACGAWLVGLGFYFIVLRPPLLPEDMRFMGTTIEHVRAALPGLESWLSKVFTVMGGFVAGAGVLTVFVARTAISFGTRGTGVAIAVAGTLTVALMSAANFVLQSDFKWLLLVPPLVWLSSLVVYSMRR